MILHYIKEAFLYFYGYTVFFYSLALIASYVILLYLAYRYTTKYKRWSNDYIKHMVKSNPYKPGISIVTGAYRGEKDIVANVNSFLAIDYPDLEICVVHNDKQSEKEKYREKGEEVPAMKELIENFRLVEVPYNYVQNIYSTHSYDRLFRSEIYPNLIVLDKVSGGTKADAINAGLNVISKPYFINTDIDCKLSKDAALQCIFPVLQDKSVIAVSGTMHMSNGFIPRKNAKPGDLGIKMATWEPSGLFQDLEYKRSFYVGKMGWSQINAMNNVSGGYGLFSTEVVRAAGGYNAASYAEDMDMVTRMAAYCCEQNRDYRIVQIPHGCCFTKGFTNMPSMMNQRQRWGRGLIQLMHEHRRLLLNPKYKRLGMVSFFNTFIFEFLAPIIEGFGMLTLVYLFLRHAINADTFWLVFFTIYFFSQMLNMFVITFTYAQGDAYDSKWNYLKLIVASLLEPIIYHPFVTFFSLKGYWVYLIGKKGQWVAIN